MSNVTSTLTLKLSDDLSGPIAKAAKELKGFVVSAQDLDRAVKLDALKQARANFRAAATDMQAAQANVKKLAAEFAATDNPTKQMTRALAAARAEAARTGQAMEQQSAAFREARTAVAAIGIPLAEVASAEERLRARTQAATEAIRQQTAAQRAQAEQVQRLAGLGPWGARPRTPTTGSVPIVPLSPAPEEPPKPSLGRRILGATGNVVGTIAPFAGPGILHQTRKAVKAGAELESERVKLRAAGVPEADLKRADAAALHEASRFPNVSRKEILERYKEARSVLLHPEEALTMLPEIAQTNSALKVLEKAGKVAPGSTQGLGFALKGAEVIGVAQHPERLRAYLDSFVKAKQVMGELITPEQIYDFATNVKSSGALLSDRFLHTTAMSLTGELRGMRAGVGIDQFVKQITGGFQGSQHAAAKEFVRLGLIRPEDVDYNKTGSVKGLKEGRHVQGWRLAQTDPDKWVQQYLLPSMKQKGIVDEQEQLALVKKLFTSSRAADIVSKLITQAESYENHAKLMHDALGLAATALFKDDPVAQLDVLTGSFRLFAETLTSPIMGTAAHAMHFVARSVVGWAEALANFNKEHPELAKWIGGGAIAVGGAGGAALTYGLLRNLMGGFGLKGSAAALDVAAANLNVAAARLGASGPANVASGAAGKAAAAEGAAAGAGATGTGKSIATAVAKGALRTLLIGGVLYEIDEAVYDALSPEQKAELKKREDAINAVKPDGKRSRTQILRAQFDKERAGLNLPPTDASAVAVKLSREQTEELSKPSRQFVPNMPLTPSQSALSAPRSLQSPADIATRAQEPVRLSIPPQSERGEVVSPVFRPPPIAGGESEARAAGQSFGASFTHGVVEELDKAISAAAKTRDTIINLLTFGAAPDLRAVTAATGSGVNGGDYGSTLRGMHSDYGIAPP